MKKDSDLQQVKTTSEREVETVEQQDQSNIEKTAQNDGFRYDYDDSSDV